MTADFRQQVVKGVGWTALQTWVLRISGLATFMVLGRLLAPEQIGMAALALAIAGFASLFVDTGLSAYLIRADEVDDTTASTAFWLTFAFSLAACVLVLIAARPIAGLLGDPALTSLIRAGAATIPVFGLSAVSMAMLVRSLGYRTIAFREVVSGLVGSVVGVGTALTGAGPWAIVAQTLTQSGVALVLLWVWNPWRPGLIFDRLRVGEILSFGLPLLGTGLVQALRDRLEPVLLGAVAGTTILGYWAIATRLLAVALEVTVKIVDLVALPVFARVKGSQVESARLLAVATSTGTALLTPVLFLLAFLSPVLIPLLFGPQWDEAIVPAQVLCLAYGVGSLGYFTRTVFVAAGRTGVDFVLSVIALGVHVVAVVAAGPFGLTALAAAMVVETAVILVINGGFLRVSFEIAPTVFSRAARVLALGAVASAGMLGVDAALRTTVVITAPLGAVVGLGLYVGLVAIVDRCLLESMIEDGRRLVSR